MDFLNESTNYEIDPDGLIKYFYEVMFLKS